MRVIRVREGALAASLAGLCAIVAACGGGSGGTSTGGSSAATSSGSATSAASPAASSAGASSAPGAYDANIAALWAGASFSEPTTAGATKPDPGKKVWMITLGAGYTAGEQSIKGFEAAAKAAGWDGRSFDGKFDPNTFLVGIRQAIANKADGIILYVIDCAAVQAGLKEAKAAGIPVIAVEAVDCGESKPGAENLFSSGGITYPGAPYTTDQLSYGPWITNYGRAAASSVIEARKGQAKVIDFKETDSLATVYLDNGFVDQMKTCAGCKIVGTVEFTAADFGPKLQQKAAQALLQHPEANGVMGSYDAPVTSGIAAAIQEAGLTKKLWTVGGEGDPPNVALVTAQNGQDAGVADPIQWEMWTAVDGMNRIFHGDPQPRISYGIGLMVWDRDHNLPAKGEFVKMPIDWEAVYKKAWGVQ